jgi:hypothetical protein
MMEVAGLKEEVTGLEIEQVEMAKTFAKAVSLFVSQEERYEPAGGEKYGSKTARVAKDVN